MAWAHAQLGFQPWIPDSLRGTIDGRALERGAGCLVVEEILLGEARTGVFTGPMLDPGWRLHFGEPENADDHIDPVTDAELLLSECSLVPIDALRDRSVEVGDVFGIISSLGGAGLGPGGGGPSGGGSEDALILANPAPHIPAALTLQAHGRAERSVTS